VDIVVFKKIFIQGLEAMRGVIISSGCSVGLLCVTSFSGSVETSELSRK